MSLNGQRWPEEVRLSKDKKTLSVRFDDGAVYELAAEYLRVESPSAEVQGHGPDQKTVVAGKRLVGISDIEPVGNYAVRIIFDDGHDTGIFTWEYLYRLGAEQDALWAQYEQRLKDAGTDRDAPMPEKSGHACGSH